MGVHFGAFGTHREYPHMYTHLWNGTFANTKTKSHERRAAPGGADGEAAAVIGSLRVSNIEQIFSRQPCNILVGVSH